MESKSQIQFYADKENEYKNRLFSFSVLSRDDAFRVLLHFHCKKNRFRAIFYKTTVSVGEHQTRFSDELIPEYNFFYSYNSDHMPTLKEAERDFEIWKLEPVKQ